MLKKLVKAVIVVSALLVIGIAVFSKWVFWKAEQSGKRIAQDAAPRYYTTNSNNREN